MREVVTGKRIQTGRPATVTCELAQHLNLSSILLDVIGAVQYGISRAFYRIVPHFDVHACRQYIHQVMAIFGQTGKEVVMMVADRSGIQRVGKLATTLKHDEGQCQSQ